MASAPAPSAATNRRALPSGSTSATEHAAAAKRDRVLAALLDRWVISELGLVAVPRASPSLTMRPTTSGEGVVMAQVWRLEVAVNRAPTCWLCSAPAPQRCA